MMPTEPRDDEMREVTKLIEARLDSRYTREDGVVESLFDGYLRWGDLTELERKGILESNVSWKGFTPEQELDVIGNVLSGDPPDEWMNGVARDVEPLDVTMQKIEWVKSMSFIVEEGKAPEPCSDCFMPWWENLNPEEQRAALLEHVEWGGIPEARRDEIIAAAIDPPDTESFERQAEEWSASLELEGMFRDLSLPPDFGGLEAARIVSAEEGRALASYERYCQDRGVSPNDPERAEFVESWLGAADEHRVAGVEAQRLDDAGVSDYDRQLDRASLRASNDNERSR